MLVLAGPSHVECRITEELHGGRRQGGPGKASCRGCWEPRFYQVIRRSPSGSGPGGQASMVLCANQTDGHKSGRERPRLPDLNHRREAKWCQEHPLCSPALRQDAGSRTAFPLPGSPVPRAVPLLEFIACVTLLNESYMENHLSSDSILFWKTQEPSKWETPCTCSARNRNHTSWNSRSVISKSFVFWTLPCVSALPASQCTK
eukprot:XP_028342453.1 uncharacterized protein LOC102995387 isoform X3 [Physeter catodon]